MIKKILLFILCLGFLAAMAGGSWLYWQVVVEPGDEIGIENIRSILGKESQVFYSDGTSRLGAFFDTAHRQYVSFDEIPEDFVNALVASEDDRFFSHYGFDIIGIMRAMLKNIQAGRVVQGGSTLTQQTAKNLFKRKERSYEAKLKELLYALRLEYRYSKEQIFEFYANQFYVSGNGHGLGVAARYYFDKRPDELSLIECAYIAGSVKRPNYYNPFTKKTKKAAALAMERGRARLHYVLEKMHQLGKIDSFTYSEAMATELEFNKGQVGFALDYAMEMVRDAVSSTEVLTALAANDISNIATSGVRIITTVDRELQEKTLAILRGELSRLDVRLRGYDRDEVLQELRELEYTGDTTVESGAFLFGVIDKVEGEGPDIGVTVDLGIKRGMGVIDREGLRKLVTALVKYETNQWTEPQEGDQAKLVSRLLPGDRVWVSVRSVDSSGNVFLSLEKYPKIQGGALVMRQGAIKGVVGGSENRFYNRAVHAQRTMGSAFKPLVYAAALQLGWNSSDLLRNTRDVFVYHGMPYFPRPDHKSPHEWVSMSWAGVHSENVASVWLLHHLCDQLSTIQFRAVAQQLDLTPRIVDGEEEPYRLYKARIRDRYGILVDQEMLRAAAYRKAVGSMETDFIFDGLVDEFARLKDLHYGLDFDKYSLELETELELQSPEMREYEIKELELRRGLLGNSYLQLEKLRGELQDLRRDVESVIPFDPFDSLGATESGALVYDRNSGQFSFVARSAAQYGRAVITKEQLQHYLQGLPAADVASFWQNISLNDTFTVSVFDRISFQVEQEEQQLLSGLPYSFDVLAQVDDFRITVGLHYLIALARQLGIRSKLEPVLSFPLGSNVVTLLEATRMYEGLVTGKIITFGGSEEEEFNDSLAIIDRIESADGDLLYRPRHHVRSTIDGATSVAIGSILENVIKFGTGRRANKEVKLQTGEGELETLDLTVPLMGKTGTANRYTNASFLGFLPAVQNNAAMDITDGYAIGVYVGYDDNKPMRRRSTRISGSAGALPAWCQITNTLLAEQHYADKLDPIDLSFYGLRIHWPDHNQLNLAVDNDAGGTIVEPVRMVSDVARFTPSILTYGTTTTAGRFVPSRTYDPFWTVEEKSSK